MTFQSQINNIEPLAEPVLEMEITETQDVLCSSWRGETLTFQTSLNSMESSAKVAVETERSEPQEVHCIDWRGGTLTFKNNLSCILNSAIISTKMPIYRFRTSQRSNFYSDEKYCAENYEPEHHRPYKYYADRNEGEHHRPYIYNNQQDKDSEVRRKTTEASNKRYYVDRDEPEYYKRTICWWHLRGLCKFDSNCYHYHPF